MDACLDRTAQVRSRWVGKKQEAVVFLHGNPTSSYLWRDVIPPVMNGGDGQRRCLAPDLIGMGMSGASVTGKYDFPDHARHLDSWFDSILSNDERVHLVLHDWGSALGFHWARRHVDRVISITVMEGIVRTFESWDEFPKTGEKIFKALRSDAGEEMVLEKNIFVEKILPASIIRELSPFDMERYRFPFSASEESRVPTLAWPRAIPFRNEGPEEVCDVVDMYNEWLRQNEDIPILHIDADPGFFAPIMREEMSQWPGLRRTETVGGIHFIQEDSGEEIGNYVTSFLDGLKSFS